MKLKINLNKIDKIVFNYIDFEEVIMEQNSDFIGEDRDNLIKLFKTFSKTISPLLLASAISESDLSILKDYLKN